MMQTIIGLVAAEMGRRPRASSVALLHRDGVVYRGLEQKVDPVEMTVAWRRDREIRPPWPPSSRRRPAGSTTSPPRRP